MECHYHPGQPGAGYCTNCHVFVCRRCAAIQSPVRCTDCALDWLEDRIDEIRRLLRNAILTSVVALTLAELILLVVAPSIATVLLGILAAYVITAFFIDGKLGPLTAPLAILNKLHELRDLEEKLSLVNRTRSG
jgi:hypothetical protein